MRFKAILAEEARKRYPLSILIIVIGVLVIPFPYLFIRFGLEQYNFWWSALGICIGLVAGSLLVGLGSLVEDMHDISMHTVGFDLEVGEPEAVEDSPEGMPEDVSAEETAGEEAPADAE